MKYMMIALGNADYEAGKPPSAELMQAIGELAETEAMKFAQDFVDAHARCGVRDMGMEVRPLFGVGDSGCPSVEQAGEELAGTLVR